MTKINSKYLIDHTFLRKKKDHQFKNPKSKIYASHLFFPFIKKKIKKKSNYIMINFGTHDSTSDILNVIKFIIRLKLHLKYRILILDKKFKLSLLKKYNLKNLLLIKYSNNLNNYYSNTSFCFGACGISLYERSFYGIPSICKPIAKNQKYNYRNFLKKNCIISFESIIHDKKFTIIKLNNMLKETKYNLSFYFSQKKQMYQVNELLKKIK